MELTVFRLICMDLIPCKLKRLTVALVYKDSPD